MDDDWVPIFVAWANGETETLDFEGAEVPQRIQDLLDNGLPFEARP